MNPPNSQVNELTKKISQQQAIVPRSVKLMLEKYNRHYAETPPPKRQRVDVACVIHATSIKRAAEELEELASTIREGGVGYAGSGGGYYMTIAWAATNRTHRPPT